MYTVENFKTKKAVKEAIAAHKRGERHAVRVYQPGPFGGMEPMNGTVYLEGPHEYHKWYAQGTLENGELVSVK